MEETKVHQGP